MDIKANAKDTDVWTRGFFILVFGVVYYFLFFLIMLVVIFQFVMKLLTTELNTQLLEFSEGLTRYVNQILNYVTFQSEQRPYPFSPWPASAATNDDELTAQKTSKKKTARKKSGKKKVTKNNDPNNTAAGPDKSD